MIESTEMPKICPPDAMDGKKRPGIAEGTHETKKQACPFCHGENISPLYYRDSRRDITGYRAHCLDCEACGPVIRLGGAYMHDWDKCAQDSLKAFAPGSMHRPTAPAPKQPAPELKP